MRSEPDNPPALMSRSGPSPLRAGLISLALASAVLLPFNFALLGNAPENDSFFTLTPSGRAGLVMLSAVFLAALYWLLAVKTRWLRRRWRGRGALIAVDIVLGWLIYLAAYHLSPQLYYSYYLTLFDTLPAQWVIDAEVDWGALRAIVIPGAKDRLSDLLASAGFWAVLPYTAMLHGAGRR